MSKLHRHHDKTDEQDDIGRRPKLAPPSADMNVTPLIDVLLVLLIIFMAALPLTQRGVDINLPLDVAAQPKTPQDTTQIMVELTAAKQLTLNKQVVTLADLDVRLRAMLEARQEKTLFIVGATTLKYGDVMPIIDVAIGAGGRVAIVTEGVRAEGAAKAGG